MTAAVPSQRIEMIPIDRITVFNPRIRSKRIFKGIVENIAEVGLKRPITVTRRSESSGPFYDLVCGQGRLEAFRELGQTEVPALVVVADPDDCLIASLVENCARRQHQAIDLLQDIGGMRTRGYSDTEIARKTGLSYDYVHAVARLLERGEQRLLRAVEAGYLPISVAMQICEADDQGVQAALHQAYENNLLRGRNLLAARRLVELRQRTGKASTLHGSRRKSSLSPENLVRAFEEDTERKRLMVKRTQATRNRLVFITEALRQLSKDESFMAMLEDEDLTTMPARIAARVAHLPIAEA
ncbi:plasmid partitioning protein RepB C-terminal domain-containing protein [Sphingorhabdus sp.]|uniref:plasmid partitioning protein RepB C-terminal domain-containing protein n=1 Tax=Sphingorhabdus sp. TaxID=1902408 RepID=UPI002FD95B51